MTKDERLTRYLDAFLERLKRGEAPAVEEYRDLLGSDFDLFVEIVEQESMATQSEVPVRLPSQLDGYELGDLIGRGARGPVYKAYGMGRPWAVKLFAPAVARGRAFMDSLRRRIELSNGLSHANWAPILAIGEDRGWAYCVMDLVVGDTLARDAVLNDVDLGLAGVADAVATLHRHGIVHGGIKPSSIVRTENGTYVLLGLGTLQIESNSALGALYDSLEEWTRVSPEQRRGLPATEHSDVWGLGATLSTTGSRLADVTEAALAGRPEDCVSAAAFAHKLRETARQALDLDSPEALTSGGSSRRSFFLKAAAAAALAGLGVGLLAKFGGTNIPATYEAAAEFVGVPPAVEFSEPRGYVIEGVCARYPHGKLVRGSGALRDCYYEVSEDLVESRKIKNGAIVFRANGRVLIQRDDVITDKWVEAPFSDTERQRLMSVPPNVTIEWGHSDPKTKGNAAEFHFVSATRADVLRPYHQKLAQLPAALRNLVEARLLLEQEFAMDAFGTAKRAEMHLVGRNAIVARCLMLAALEMMGAIESNKHRSVSKKLGNDKSLWIRRD